MKIIESDFSYRGYRCVTTFTDLGHRCGYVGVPEGHPLYGKNYHSQVKVSIKEMIEKEKDMNKRSPITAFILGCEDPDNLVDLGYYFNVHGGITYADGGKDSHHPIDSDLWWFGFDCGHYGDCPDYEMLEKTWGDNEMVRHRLEDRWLYEEYEVRTLEYVEQECINLVDQIISLIEKYY